MLTFFANFLLWLTCDDDASIIDHIDFHMTFFAYSYASLSIWYTRLMLIHYQFSSMFPCKIGICFSIIFYCKKLVRASFVCIFTSLPCLDRLFSSILLHHLLSLISHFLRIKQLWHVRRISKSFYFGIWDNPVNLEEIYYRLPFSTNPRITKYPSLSKQ